jgi:hypothetical protein
MWGSSANEITEAPADKGVTYGDLTLKALSLPHLLEMQSKERGDEPFIQTWDGGVKETVSFR